MKDFFQRNGLWVLIAALLLTAVVSLSSALIPNFTAPIRNVIGIVASPLQSGVTSFTDWVESLYDYAFRYQELQDKVTALEKQLADVQQENREAEDALSENTRLRELLNLQEKRSDFVFESATITGRSATTWESTLTISKGSSSGIERNDAVITENGYLVGIVGELGENWATVVTLIDPDTSMGAKVYRTDSSAILEGSLDLMVTDTCRLSYLDSDADLISGDEVLTSGKGGVYPSDIVIGYVSEVKATASGMEKYAVITPAAALDDLSEVFIIKDFDIVE